MQMPSAGAPGLWLPFAIFFLAWPTSAVVDQITHFPLYAAHVAMVHTRHCAPKVHRTLLAESPPPPPLLGLIGYARPEGHARVDSHDEREYQLV